MSKIAEIRFLDFLDDPKELLTCGFLQMIRNFPFYILTKFQPNPSSHFLRKSEKGDILTTFSYFMDEPRFFSKIGLRHFSSFINVQHRAKFQKNR